MTVTGTAAGVPFLAVPPAGDRATAPVVVAWHLLSPPCTPEAFAAAIPLAGLDAWRIYVGLPLSGARLPQGGYDEVMRLGYVDAVRHLQYPIPHGAAAEFPAAFAALRAQLGFGADVPVGLVGGSAGSAAALLALVNGAGPRVSAVVALSPITRLEAATDATGRVFGVEYPWDAETRGLVAELDFVARAAEVAASGAALRLVVGAEDDAEGFVRPAQELAKAVPGADLVVLEGLGHDLAEAPGVEPAPQTAGAARVDALAVEWLREHLS
ncbi:alpha/beta hydrolase [Pseudonocardia xishanensis]|uniref:Prolyl oligopeptidase family serine peptidase n=1 Tax=Pseudonocardia xishanensis TaxID=630995 RepID=A0ABP8RTW4_9PSEU